MNRCLGKGSIGTSMNSIIFVRNGREVKKKAPRRCNCKKCIHAIAQDNIVNCYITGEIAVNKQYCYHFKSAEAQIKYNKSNKKYSNKYRRKTKIKGKKKKEE